MPVNSAKPCEFCNQKGVPNLADVGLTSPIKMLKLSMIRWVLGPNNHHYPEFVEAEAHHKIENNSIF